MISLAKGTNAAQHLAGLMRLPSKNLTLLLLFLKCYRNRLLNCLVLNLDDKARWWHLSDHDFLIDSVKMFAKFSTILNSCRLMVKARWV